MIFYSSANAAEDPDSRVDEWLTPEHFAVSLAAPAFGLDLKIVVGPHDFVRRPFGFFAYRVFRSNDVVPTMKFRLGVHRVELRCEDRGSRRGSTGLVIRC